MSFDHIWGEYSVPIKSFIKRRVDQEQDVEDILQNVFLKIHNNLNTLIETDKIYAWIYTVTRNAIHDFYREHKKEACTTVLSEDIICEQESEELENYEIAQCLKIMIQYLPEKYKEAIIYTEFQNHTQQELANKLGLSVSGAKSRVQRGRALLKDMLMNCCALEQDCNGNVINYEIKSNNNKYC